ncbi:PaaI family thioesterase [uncultured Flavobacterium sp.]|uniref:PaaI family thioesterase n=1 Tax=uncultured Flavobacterium sp. TaxID=165435 RepID=UPI0025F3EEB3|nr:PaaI family thioesterase [uncultured Flavobacterium sp.]
MERTRNFTWEDPKIGAEKARKMSGLDYLNAMNSGEIPPPPIIKTMDFTLDKIEKGKISFGFTPEEFHYNPIGTVHGGVIATILDSAMGCTIHSVLEEGIGYTTLELKINYLKAVTIDSGKLTAVGKIIHGGKSTALVEAQLVDENGNVYAHAVSTCMILRK